MDYSKLTKAQCINKLQEKDRELGRLRESERRYQAIFRYASVSLWEEDCSEVRRELDRLRAEGVENIREYLRSHPETTWDLVRKIRILDINETTRQLYGAESKEELLGSLESIFVPETEAFFIEEMVAIAERRFFFEGETMGRTLQGEPLHLLICMSIPPDREEHDYVLVSIVDISSRKEREEEYAQLLKVTEEQRIRSESMREVTLALTSTFDSSRVLDIILSHAQRLVNFTAVNVSLLENGRIRIVCFYGYEQYGNKKEDAEELYDSRELKNVRQITEEQVPVLIPDTQKDPDWVVYSRIGWIRSFLGMPLVYGNRLIGMINFDSDRPEEFSHEDIQRLEPFVNAAAVALENARLYEELERKLAERSSVEQQLRASLKEKHVLLEEVHHRVKNNLNVVGSMLSLQLNRISSVEEAQEALRVSENRIHSMSLIHEHLYQSEDLAAIDMRSYVENILADLRQVYQGGLPIEVTTRSDSEQVYLDIHQAIPLGLILNELISNALEHAFQQASEGQLRVVLVADSTAKGWYELRVKDNGRGLPEDVDPEKTKTLGLQLVMLLSEQLGGSITTWRENGTEIVLSFPK